MEDLDAESIFGTPRPKSASHVIGQNVDDLSAPELSDRIEALTREILRLEEAIRAREATKQAARSIFKG